VILSPLERLPIEQRRAWAAARVWAAHQVPYMASALLALEPVVVDQSEDSPADRVDLSALPADEHWHIYLDLRAVENMDVPTIGFWLVHQVSHLLRNHASRCPSRVPAGPSGITPRQTKQRRNWNLAADAEINDDLVAGDTSMPASAVTPRILGLPDSLTAEDYWDALGGAECKKMNAGDIDDATAEAPVTEAPDPGTAGNRDWERQVRSCWGATSPAG